jgi:hypothetical protein
VHPWASSSTPHHRNHENVPNTFLHTLKRDGKESILFGDQ